jgi:hypothetical protein
MGGADPGLIIEPDVNVPDIRLARQPTDRHDRRSRWSLIAMALAMAGIAAVGIRVKNLVDQARRRSTYKPN